MAVWKIFVDGAVGTTGLRIHERLENRRDVEIITLPEKYRKDLSARTEAVNTADVSILCLPDEAAREVAAAARPEAKICDTSTAHRTLAGWTYGFPELAGRRQAIAKSARVAVPGCHATGFLALAAPLIEKEIIQADQPLVCQSLTGYSGGGKKMIAAYEAEPLPKEYTAPRLYGLSLQHKHIPEMTAVAGLETPPLFTPVVSNYYSGMLVSMPVPAEALAPGFRRQEELAGMLSEYYAGAELITVHPAGTLPPDGTLSACGMAGKDSLEIFVLGNDQQILLAARFDNLGKGASGAAVQCMNLMLGLPETQGLVIE